MEPSSDAMPEPMRPGQHQGRKHRPQFADQGQCDELSRHADGTISAKSAFGLDGKDSAGEKSCQDNNCEGPDAHAVHLQDDFPPINRSAEKIRNSSSWQKSVGLNFPDCISKKTKGKSQHSCQRILHSNRLTSRKFIGRCFGKSRTNPVGGCSKSLYKNNLDSDGSLSLECGRGRL